MRRILEANSWIVLKPLIFALCVVFASVLGSLSAQTTGWQPSPGHTQILIWPGAAPDLQPAAGPEDATTMKGPPVATPPTFLVQAEDDNVDSVNDSLAYYIALKNAAVPVEMHLYAQGRHAFGLRRTKFPITEWPQLAEKWLATIGMISQ